MSELCSPFLLHFYADAVVVVKAVVVVPEVVVTVVVPIVVVAVVVPLVEVPVVPEVPAVPVVVVPIVVVPGVPLVVVTAVAATVAISGLIVFPVEMVSADCFSEIARVMDSVLERKVVLALPKLLLSSSEQAATVDSANAVNSVSRLASRGAVVT